MWVPRIAFNVALEWMNCNRKWTAQFCIHWKLQTKESKANKEKTATTKCRNARHWEKESKKWRWERKRKRKCDASRRLSRLLNFRFVFLFLANAKVILVRLTVAAAVSIRPAIFKMEMGKTWRMCCGRHRHQSTLPLLLPLYRWYKKFIEKP